MKKLAVVFCLPLFLITLFHHRSVAAAHKTFSNSTYNTDYLGTPAKITLIDGSGEIEDRRYPGHRSLYYMERYVLGDFDWDGRKDDTAVIIGESCGVGGDVYLAFLIHDGRNFVHQQSIYLGPSTIVNSMKERDGNVIIDMFVRQRGDCQAGPTKRVIARYDFLDPPSDEVTFPRPLPE